MPTEKGSTWREVIDLWWPIHETRMQAKHQPVGDKYTVIGFHETIELAMKEEADRLAQIEAKKETIDQEVPSAPDD